MNLEQVREKNRGLESSIGWKAKRELIRSIQEKRGVLPAAKSARHTVTSLIAAGAVTVNQAKAKPDPDDRFRLRRASCRSSSVHPWPAVKPSGDSNAQEVVL